VAQYYPLFGTYNPGDVVNFAVSFSDNATLFLVGVTNPQVVITDPSSTITYYDLGQPNEVGVYEYTWTIPDDALTGQYLYAYQAVIDMTPNLVHGMGAFQVEPLVSDYGGTDNVPLSMYALSTVPNVKIYMGIPSTDTSEDDWIAQEINTVSRQIKTYCGRHFELRSISNELHSGTGRQYLLCNHRPLVDIYNIQIVDISVTDWLPPTEFEAEGGMIFRQYGWFPGLLAIRSGLDIGDPHPSYIFKNISLSYSAGYILPKDSSAAFPRTLPEDVEKALFKQIDFDYTKRLATGYLQQKTPVGEEIQFAANEMQPDVKDLLSGYVEHLHGEVI
jgi:hypothetical protein